MKHVISVSLGSSKRDHAATVTLLGEEIRVERQGVDGDFNAAIERIRSLDGEVDAIGLGGIDLYLRAGNRSYKIVQAQRLAEAATRTPVVDGSGLKDTLERATIRWLIEQQIIDPAHSEVLVVCAVDRFGMAETLVEAGAKPVFGDLIFALGVPIPIRSMRGLRCLAALLLPLLRRMPIKVLYPTGSSQEQQDTRYARYFEAADIVAGDFHFIRRYMAEEMTGKTVITNTVTAADVELLRDRGVACLVTTTPEIEGRSFGTNVMEGVMVALMGKSPDDITADDYRDLMSRLAWTPRVERLQQASSPDAAAGQS